MLKNSRLFPLLIGAASLLLLTPAIAQTDDASALTPATNSAISFRRPLRIDNIRVSSIYERRRTRYRFIVDFPADAVESLEKLTFEQVGGAGYPRYRGGGNYAFDDTEGMPLSLSSIESNRETRTITVKFDPPVEPGRQITIGFDARNPRSDTYVYKATAFPVGATEGQYAGVERFGIFDQSTRRFRR